MNRSRLKSITVGELKNNMYLLERFPADMELSEFVDKFDKWIDTLSDTDYNIVLERIKRKG